MKEFGEALGKIPATLFSPAKMVYIAYLILLFKKPPATLTSWRCEFFVVSVLFLLAEIAHNDWGRIWLNNNAENNRPVWLRPKQD